MAPLGRLHAPWRAVGGERLDDFTRQKKRRAGVAIRPILAAHLEDARVDAGRPASDDPSLVADANRLAWGE